MKTFNEKFDEITFDYWIDMDSENPIQRPLSLPKDEDKAIKSFIASEFAAFLEELNNPDYAGGALSSNERRRGYDTRNSEIINLFEERFL